MNVTCPMCRHVFDADAQADDEMSRAVREDATAFHIEVLPMREPVDPEAKPLRAEIGIRHA